MKKLFILVLIVFFSGCMPVEGTNTVNTSHIKELCLNGVVYYSDIYGNVSVVLAVDSTGNPITCEN